MILKGSPKSFWDSTYSKLQILPQIDEPLIIIVLIYQLDSKISPFDFDGIGWVLLYKPDLFFLNYNHERNNTV